MNQSDPHYLLVPEHIVRSVKDLKNRPLNNSFTNMNNERAFLCNENRKMMVRRLYLLHKEKGGDLDPDNFANLVNARMDDFAIKHNLHGFESLTKYDWLHTIHYINKKFIDTNRELYNDLIPQETDVFQARFAGTGLDLDGNEIFQAKKGDELTVDDMRNLNVYKKMEVVRDPKKFRYGNKIPFWQNTSMRRYDRSNEGFRHGSMAERASLQNPIRGYNMKKIRKTIGREKRKDWRLL